jgi:FlaG/FlaF family flagellin (archaellin)
MFKNKKAVTPLVGMLLLVVFAIALGSVVMSFTGKGSDSGGHGEDDVSDAESDLGGQAISAIDPCMSELMTKYEQGKITSEEYSTAKSIVNK